MAETPIFSPYFRGTGIPGWLSRMFWPGNLDEQNANIEAARIREAAGEDRADILNELKAQMGPRYAKVPYIEPSSEKLRRAALLMQPSSELTGQEQLGPVKQSPTFDWM
ncbi:MAG TPA: hypothetical protein VJ301_12035, partial [Propionibacteriaceae bacterium]|nr:hypothetical protein [Propionibacteriaceae bacterium]